MLIDPTFSIYENIEKNHPSNIFLTTVAHLNLFSRIIEREIFRRGSHTPIYIGVQRFTNLDPILETYKEIAAFAEIVHLFGVADGPMPICNPLHFIPIEEGSSLAREWFILVDQPDYTKVLSAREISPQENRTDHRTFVAVLTNERKSAERAIEALSEEFGLIKDSR